MTVTLSDLSPEAKRSGEAKGLYAHPEMLRFPVERGETALSMTCMTQSHYLR